MPRHNKSDTPPEKQRKPKGSVVGTVRAPLTRDELAARGYFELWLKEHPIEGVPANESGAIGLAILREARRLGLKVHVPGWPDPVQGDEEDPAALYF